MSWQQLLSIAKEAADEAARQQTEPPKACPNDGEPLTAGSDGSLHCRWDGWQWPRDRHLV